MTASEFRAEARRKLAGKWEKAVLLTLAFAFVVFIFTFIGNILKDNIKEIFSLVETIILVPLAFGFIVSFIKLYNEEEIGAFDFISAGFQNFGKAWGISLWTFVKLLLPLILLIVSIVVLSIGIVQLVVVAGATIFNLSQLSTSTPVLSTPASTGLLFIGFILYIISFIWLAVQSYYYQLSQMIAIENPDMTAKESVEKSRELMDGNRFKLFCLQLSFIGWAIISAITLGIGFLWLAPYMEFSFIAFYKKLAGAEETVEVDSTQSTEE